MSGKITWYNNKQGFGFISPQIPRVNGNPRYFETHSRELFSANQIVTYDEETNPANGLKMAIHVKPVQ